MRSRRAGAAGALGGSECGPGSFSGGARASARWPSAAPRDRRVRVRVLGLGQGEQSTPRVCRCRCVRVVDRAWWCARARVDRDVDPARGAAWTPAWARVRAGAGAGDRRRGGEGRGWALGSRARGRKVGVRVPVDKKRSRLGFDDATTRGSSVRVHAGRRGSR